MRRERWLKPILDLLKQGITPEKIALTIALGTLLGTIPMLGTTTVLCSIAALVFRLNIPVIQLVNGVVYPLQLILLIPFYRMGAWMFGADASTLSLNGVTALFRTGMLHAMNALWVVTIHALAAWIVAGAAVCTAVYAVALPVARHYALRMSSEATVADCATGQS